MLQYALIFLLVALVSSILGLGIYTSAATIITKVLFCAFIVLFLATLFRDKRV